MPRTPGAFSKPTAMLVPNAFKHDPKRARARENEPDTSLVGPLPGPPSWFTKAEVQAWHDIVDRAHPGVLCNADWAEVITTVRLWACFKTDALAFDGSGMTVSAISEMRKGFAALGMSPVARARVAATKAPEKKNRFTSLDDGLKDDRDMVQ